MAENDASLIVKRARSAFKAGKLRSVQQRKQALGNILRLINETEGDFVLAMKKDLNKPRFESILSEIEMCRNEVINILNHLEEWTKPQQVEKGIHLTGIPVYIQYQPYGVVFVIGAWNYPYQLVMLPIIGAIAAGNTVIVKPSEVSAEFAAVFEKSINRYFDNDCIQVVNGGVAITTALLKEKMDYILYTGSGGVGKIVLRAAAEHLTPVTLELGGKSPCYIDENVTMKTVAHRLVWGKLMNAGQTCIAPDIVLCKPSVNAKLVHYMKLAIEEYYGKDPQKSSDYGRIVNDRHFERIMNLVTTSSGKVVIGGGSSPSELYIEPTVIVDVKDTDPVMQDEIFGPVLPIYNVDSKDEAIAFINSRPKPLTLYVMSNDSRVIKQFQSETSSGSFVANDFLMHAAIETLPFGGIGDSGMGAYHGRFSFELFSHKRGCMIGNSGMEWILSLRYPPFKDRNLGLLQWAMRKSLRNPFYGWISMLTLLAVCAGFAFKILSA